MSTFLVRTLRCAPGVNYGNVESRDPYPTREAARAEVARRTAAELEARKRGERAFHWFIFDYAELRDERPVPAVGVADSAAEARRWAAMKLREAEAEYQQRNHQ